MGHLMSSVANTLPAFEKTHEPIGVGSIVAFNGRIGHLRQGRNRFPALVFGQHPDDGSLELLVFFEPEDVIWEKRVLPWSEENPGRSWSPVENQPGGGLTGMDYEMIEAIRSGLKHLTAKIFGEWQEPEKSVMDYLADFDARLAIIEHKMEAKKGK